MNWGRLLAALLICLTTGLTAAVSATTASRGSSAITPLDVASTSRFIEVSLVFDEGIVARHSQADTAANALIRHLASHCPRILAAAPPNGTPAQQRSLTTLTLEASTALALSEISPLRTIATRSADRFARLRWSHDSINRAAAAYVRQTRAFVAINAPDFCTDAKRSQATKFSTVPADAGRFVQLVSVASRSSSRTIPRLLDMMTPFVTRSEKSAVKRLRALETQVNNLAGRSAPRLVEKLTKVLFG